MSLCKILEAFRIGREYTQVKGEIVNKIDSKCENGYKLLDDADLLERRLVQLQRFERVIKQNGSPCVKLAYHLGRFSRPRDYLSFELFKYEENLGRD